MTGYLDQLERDLVDAIDRHENTRAWHRARRPWRRLRRPHWMPLAATVTGIAALVVVGASVHPAAHEQPAIAPPPRQSLVKPPAPIPPNTPLRLVGDLARIDSTTWRGDVALRPRGGVTGGGDRTGTLTINGEVNVDRRPCCDTPQHPAANSRHTIRFIWTTPGGTVSGCIANTVLRRPHSRFVWDGIGHVTRATGVLARYRGRGAGLAGDMPASTPGRARIILGANSAGPRGPC